MKDKKTRRLPKKLQGAAVMRGLGMKSADLDKFTERKALAQFEATRDMWIVVEDSALEDFDSDGRPDVIAGGRASHNVKIYWNLGSK